MFSRVALGIATALMALSSMFLAACAAQQAPSSTPAGSSGSTGLQPKRGGVLTILMFIGGDPKSFDTHQESDVATLQAIGGTYENLVRFNPLRPDEVVPDLAERWELAPDGKSYTFHLQKDVKFHNGDPFTAEDVKFSLERIKEPPKGIVSPRRDMLGAITSVEAIDESTVKVHLSRPNPSLLPVLGQGWMSMFSKKWVQAKGDKAPEKESMGTGPFRLKEHLRGTSVFQERNPTYRTPGLPYLDGIKTFIIPDPSTRFAGFRTGQVMVYGLSPSELATLQKEMSDKISFQRAGGLGFGSLVLNTTRKPYDDPRVREALNLSIDKHAAIDVLQQGDADLGGYMPPSGPWTLPAEEVLKLPGYGKDKTRDIARAKELLAQAGFTNGFSADLLTSTAQNYQDLVVFLSEQLKKIGVTATIKQVQMAETYDLIRQGDFQLLAWNFGFSLGDPDAVYGEFYLCNSPRNYARLCTQEVDTLFDKQSQEVDPAKRTALVQELERRAIPTASKIMTAWSRRRAGVWNFVQNYVEHPSGYNNWRFDQIWLNQ